MTRKNGAVAVQRSEFALARDGSPRTRRDVSGVVGRAHAFELRTITSSVGFDVAAWRERGVGLECQILPAHHLALSAQRPTPDPPAIAALLFLQPAQPQRHAPARWQPRPPHRPAHRAVSSTGLRHTSPARPPAAAAACMHRRPAAVSSMYTPTISRRVHANTMPATSAALAALRQGASHPSLAPRALARTHSHPRTPPHPRHPPTPTPQCCQDAAVLSD